MPETVLLEKLQLAIAECYEHDMPETAAAFSATRDYVLAMRLTDEQRAAFAHLIDNAVERATRERRAASFWQTRSGKAAVVGIVISGGIAVFNFVSQIVHTFGH